MGGGTTAGPATVPTTKWQYAGPFLRYQNIAPDTCTWTGSVLFLIKGAASSTGGSALGSDPAQRSSAGGDLSAGASAAASAPSLVFYDDAATAQNTQLAATDVAAKLGGLAVGQDLGTSGSPASGGARAQPPTLLDVCQGWQFWRFELEFELGEHERAVTYTVQVRGAGQASTMGAR